MERVVIRADVLGFCMGVRKAVKSVETMLDTKTPGPHCTFGPVVHNSKVIERFEKRGVAIETNVQDITSGTVVIRAHGVTPQIKNSLQVNNIHVIDGTCPKVRGSQKLVEKYSNLGYFIILVGDENHGEIEGLKGYAANHVVVQTKEDLKPIEIPEKVMILAQTTLSDLEFQNVCAYVLDKNPNALVRNTICSATGKRQQAVMDLAKKVQAIVVVGGKNSSNTTRLYKIALQEGVPAWHIEDASQLPEEIKNYSKIGLTAGASTPDWVIDDVEKCILSL